jgi:hypothetical protein
LELFSNGGTVFAAFKAAGVKKAEKNGVNCPIDGLTYFVEDLVASSPGAAATLVAKLIPPETPPQAPPTNIRVQIHPVVAGSYFSPEAVAVLRATGQLPDDAVIHLVQSPSPPEKPVISEPDDEPDNNVVVGDFLKMRLGGGGGEPPGGGAAA